MAVREAVEWLAGAPGRPRPLNCQAVMAPDPQNGQAVMGIDCSLAVDTCTRAPATADVLPYPTENVHDKFTFGREIGRGSYGIVRECFDRETGAVYACKVIQKRHLSTVQDRQVVARELGLMHLVKGHPWVVRLEGMFEDDKEIVIVMELCNGGELYHQILSNGRFPEPEAAAIFAQIVDAIRHCHSKGIVHRDLKPENILFHHRSLPKTDPSAPDAFTVEVKLADFGLGVWLRPGEFATARIGSLMYEAPEVVCGSHYDFKADMWSLGIILHALLSGTLPFIDPDQQRLARKICSGAFELRYSPWPFVSDEAKALVRKLIVLNPKSRPTAAEVLADPWLVRHLPPPSPRSPPSVEQKRSLSDAEMLGSPRSPCSVSSSHRGTGGSGCVSRESSHQVSPATGSGSPGGDIVSFDSYTSCLDAGEEGGSPQTPDTTQESFVSALSFAADDTAALQVIAGGEQRKRGQARRSRDSCCFPFPSFNFVFDGLHLHLWCWPFRPGSAARDTRASHTHSDASVSCLLPHQHPPAVVQGPGKASIQLSMQGKGKGKEGKGVLGGSSSHHPSNFLSRDKYHQVGDEAGQRKAKKRGTRNFQRFLSNGRGFGRM